MPAMLLFLICLVVILGVIVMGNLHKMHETDVAAKRSAEFQQLLERELAKVKEQLAKATSLQDERARALRDGEKAMDLLSKITIWNEPWARNESGQVLCFYCGAIERPDNTVEHRVDCNYLQGYNLLMDHDVARGVLPSR